MKINWATLAAAVAVGILGALNTSLAGGTITVPTDWTWIVPVLSAVLVAITRHITEHE